jgi:anthranilate synthase component 1
VKKYHRIRLASKPDLINLAHCYPKKFPAILNSHSNNNNTGRFSILFAGTKQKIMARNKGELLALFNKIDQPIKVTQQHELPFYAGWFLYLSYASIIAWENVLAGIKHDPEQPLALAIRCRSAVIIDHSKDQYWLVADSDKRIKKLQKILANHCQQAIKEHRTLTVQADDVSGYTKNVNKIKDYIRQGDVYQVNLARKWQVKCNGKINALTLYQSLSENNPAPFAGLLQTKKFAVISSSPERLVRVSDRTIESRPIAGTRPRHADRQKDQDLIQELINHPKEQAEHIMLIDLERNDLGRVCEIGTVKVDEFMSVESYAKVHHIVSNIKGELAKNTTFFDVIKATFPGGTITGCPKIRCMQIIDKLEDYARGAYTGSMGYITDDGRMDLNILIRTFTLVNNKLSFHAGAGIVYDSIAEKEAEESQHKAQALINSL